MMALQTHEPSYGNLETWMPRGGCADDYDAEQSVATTGDYPVRRTPPILPKAPREGPRLGGVFKLADCYDQAATGLLSFAAKAAEDLRIVKDAFAGMFRVMTDASSVDDFINETATDDISLRTAGLSSPLAADDKASLRRVYEVLACDVWGADATLVFDFQGFVPTERDRIAVYFAVLVYRPDTPVEMNKRMVTFTTRGGKVSVVEMCLPPSAKGVASLFLTDAELDRLSKGFLRHSRRMADFADTRVFAPPRPCGSPCSAPYPAVSFGNPGAASLNTPGSAAVPIVPFLGPSAAPAASFNNPAGSPAEYRNAPAHFAAAAAAGCQQQASQPQSAESTPALERLCSAQILAPPASGAGNFGVPVLRALWTPRSATLPLNPPCLPSLPSEQGCTHSQSQSSASNPASTTSSPRASKPSSTSLSKPPSPALSCQGAGGGSADPEANETSPAFWPHAVALPSPHMLDRPCKHDRWDSIRVKNRVVVLRCRVCASQWKAKATSFQRCAAFLANSECFDPDCAHVHVYRKKPSVF
ncbi:hypothetical protein DIPPA_32396 [Diplonema papillatum]|nr:hypothetical protein DIPPA_32396 [Diplonema papillatum]